MDILESGMDRPEREPSRRRTAGLAAAALVIGGGAYWLHMPDKPAKAPAPVAVSSSPTPTPSASPKPTPTPSATQYPFHADVVSNTALTCAQFLDAVVKLPDGAYGLHFSTDKRTSRKRDVTYTARTGTVQVHAQCGPTIWGGPVGQHVGDDNEDYIDAGSRSNEPEGARPSVAIFRADTADGWYEIQAGGPDGRLGDGATLNHLMGAIAHTPLINWVPPGKAGQD